MPNYAVTGALEEIKVSLFPDELASGRLPEYIQRSTPIEKEGR